MGKFHTAALAALAAIAAIPQPAFAAPIEPNVDSAERRQELRSLAACLAQHRPGWARRTLAAPYMSNNQAYIASEALSGSDGCINRRNDTEVTFRTSSVVASLAELYLRNELRQVDFGRVSRTLATMAPRNVTEDFALCMASRNPAAARDLTLSDFGSAAEAEAAGRLAGYVEACTAPGETLTVDMQALRALSAIALYRGVSMVQGN